MTVQNTKLDTSQYTGSSVFIRLKPKSVMTEGVAYVAHEMNAHWLVHDIDVFIRNYVLTQCEKGSGGFFVVTLKKDGDKGATLTFEDGNGEFYFMHPYEYTSFDFSRVDDEKLTLWVQENGIYSYTIFLPSEY